MKKCAWFVIPTFLTALGAVSSSAGSPQAFPEDPLIDSQNHFIYNTFMELDLSSGNNLHYGIDIAGAEHQTVKPGTPAGEFCKIIGEGTNFRLIYAEDRMQQSSYVACRLQHIYPNPAFQIGDRLNYDDTLGALDYDDHLHLEIDLSPDGVIENQDLRNPERYAFENASWMADSQEPVVDSLVIHPGSPDTLQIWVHDTTDESPDYFNGIYKLLLKVNDVPVDSVVLDRYLTRDGSYPPEASQIYYDTGPKPSGYNNPNVLNYKLIGEIDSVTWRIAWWDASGNHGESAPVEPPVTPVAEMTLIVQEDYLRVAWRLDTASRFRSFDVWTSSREAGGYARINDEPIPAVPGRTEYEFAAGLPEEGTQAWYRVTGEDTAGTSYLIAEGRYRFSLPRITSVRARPNPSGTEFQIELDIARGGTGRVDVFTPAGRRIRTIDEGRLGRGVHNYSWDGRDANGRPVSPGVYFLRVQSDDEGKHPSERIVQKLIVLR